MADPPPFDIAQRQLLEFLQREYDIACSEILWIYREDFYEPDLSHVVVPRRLPPRNGALAASDYAQGASAGLGVELHVEFVSGGRAYGWVYVPRDAVEAEYALVSSGLKLSLRSSLPQVKQVSAISWLWRCLTSREFRHQLVGETYVPCRIARRA